MIGNIYSSPAVQAAMRLNVHTCIIFSSKVELNPVKSMSSSATGQDGTFFLSLQINGLLHALGHFSSFYIR